MNGRSAFAFCILYFNRLIYVERLAFVDSISHSRAFHLHPGRYDDFVAGKQKFSARKSYSLETTYKQSNLIGNNRCEEESNRHSASFCTVCSAYYTSISVEFFFRRFCFFGVRACGSELETWFGMKLHAYRNNIRAVRSCG